MGDNGVVSTLNVVSEGGFWGILINPPVENFPEDRGNGKKPPQNVPNLEILDDIR